MVTQNTLFPRASKEERKKERKGKERKEGTSAIKLKGWVRSGQAISCALSDNNYLLIHLVLWESGFQVGKFSKHIYCLVLHPMKGQ